MPQITTLADLLPRVLELSREEKIQIYKFLIEQLKEQGLEPLPKDFPPPQDQCFASREELESARREPGIYRTDEVIRHLQEL